MVAHTGFIEEKEALLKCKGKQIHVGTQNSAVMQQHSADKGRGFVETQLQSTHFFKCVLQEPRKHFWNLHSLNCIRYFNLLVISGFA